MTFRTRFAPSPTGLLHLGHAYSALTAFDAANDNGGECLLRIEDTDSARCRSEYETAIYDDLRFLGLEWPEPVMRQSERLSEYSTALNQLIDLGVCYPCSCTRRDIRAALSAPQEEYTQPMTPDGMLYPGTCRGRSMDQYAGSDAVRLDMRRAMQLIDNITDLSFTETGPTHRGTHFLEPLGLVSQIGDFVLARKDIAAAAYHLSVVVDDAAQSINDVIRGEDLFEATVIHRILQALLGLATPTYHHHTLIRDGNGKRLAKRDDARAISKYRADGASPHDIRKLVGL